MARFEHVEMEREGQVGFLWLNRPDKLNAMSADMWADIPTAMAELDEDDEVRVVIIGGRGSCFTVGIDLGMLAELSPEGASRAVSNANMYRTVRRLQQTASCLADSPKPVIAAVHGYCLGAGMDLITACDIRVAAADATFSIRETRMGLVADVGTLQRLPGIVGAGHVADLAFTGRELAAEHALRIGLVNSIHPDVATTLTAATELAEEIAANSPLVVQGVKRVLAANDGRTLEQALDYVAQWNASYLLSNDLMEAINAYLEKRPPRFQGS